jgi:hypothetical protein
MIHLGSLPCALTNYSGIIDPRLGLVATIDDGGKA